jgi:hypothetical protein
MLCTQKEGPPAAADTRKKERAPKRPRCQPEGDKFGQRWVDPVDPGFSRQVWTLDAGLGRAATANRAPLPTRNVPYESPPENTFLMMSMVSGDDKELPAEEVRRDEGLRALLRMKPKRHEEMKLGKPRNPRKKAKAKKPA